MAKDKDCFSLYEDAMQRAEVALTREQKAAIKQHYDVLKAMEENSRLDPSGKSFQEKSQAYFKEFSQNSQRYAAQQAHDLQVLVRNTDFVDQPAFREGADGATEAILTRIGQPTRPGNDVAGNMQSLRGALEGRFRKLRDAELEKFPGLQKIYASIKNGSDQMLQVMQAIDKLNHGEAVTGIPKELEAIAEMHVKINKLLLDTTHDKGIYLGNLTDRIMLQESNPEKMLGSAKTVREAEDAWVDKQLNDRKLDHDRTFGEFSGNPEKEEEILRRRFRYRVAGVSGELESMDQEMGPFRNLGKAEPNRMDQIAKSRGLHYMDAESSWKEHRDFADTGLFENLDNDIKNKSKLIAMIDTLGARPGENLNQLIDDTLKKLQTEAGNGNAISGTQAEHLESHRQRIMNAMDTYLSKNAIVPNRYITNSVGDTLSRAAVKFLEVGRAVTAVSDLGNHGLHALSSTPVGLYLAKNVSGESWHSLMVNSLYDHFANMNPSVREATLAEYYMTANDMRDQLEMYRGTPFENTRDGMMRAIDFVGAARYGFDMPKIAVVKSFSRMAGQALAEGANHINPQMKAYFLMGGIGDTEIKALAKSLEIVNGRTNFTPAAIDRIPLDHPEFMAAAKEAGMSPRAYRTELSLKAGSMFNTMGSMVSHGAGIREQSFLNQGTKAGTVGGETLRAMTQFKTFPVHAVNAMEFISKAARIDPAMLESGNVASVGRDPKVYTGLILATGAATIFTHMLVKAQSNAVQAKIAGKDVGDAILRAFHTPDSGDVMDALIRNPATGLAGDVVGGKKFGNNYNTMGGILGGPLLSQIDDVKDLIYDKRAPYGQTPSNAKRLEMGVHLIRKNSFGQNQALLKPIFDWFEHDVVDDAISPGAGAKFDEKQATYDNPDTAPKAHTRKARQRR